MLADRYYRPAGFDGDGSNDREYLPLLPILTNADLRYSGCKFF